MDEEVLTESKKTGNENEKLDAKDAEVAAKKKMEDAQSKRDRDMLKRKDCLILILSLI